MSKPNEKRLAHDATQVAVAIEQLLIGACIKYDQTAVIAGAMTGLSNFIAVAMGTDPLTPKKLNDGKMQNGRDFTIERFTEHLDNAIEFMADENNRKLVHEAYADMAKEVVGVIAASYVADAMMKAGAEAKPEGETVH